MRFLLCNIFALIPALALASGTATIERAHEYGADIAAGDVNACALFETGLRCWGDDSFGQLQIPPLHSPRAVAVGWAHLCALDDEGVKCWGDGSRFQLAVPPLSHPRAIAAGWYHTCALDDTGVHCWGDNSVAQLVVPNNLQHPRALAAGAFRTCVTDDAGVQCFGDYLFFSSPLPNGVKSLRQYKEDHSDANCAELYRGYQCWIDAKLYVERDPPPVPKFSHLRDVAVGIANTCALDENGVQCWGEDFNEQLAVPPLKHPRALTAGGGHYCALDDLGMHCWGSNQYGQRNVPATLFNPRAIAASIGASCALDGNGIQCWGDDSDGLRNVPRDVADGAAFGTIGGPFLLFNLDRALRSIAKLVYRYKRDFLLETAKDLASLPADNEGTEARLFVLHLLVPLLEDGSSPVMQDIVLPRLHSEIAAADLERKVSSLADLPLTKTSFRLALELSANAVSSARAFVGQEKDRASLEGFLLDLASLIASSPAGEAPQSTTLKRARGIFQAHHDLIEQLTTLRKTRGFGMMLLEIEHALEAHES